MSDVAIRVENLGKMYRIGGKQERYKRFTETAMAALTAPVRRLRNIGKPAPPEETFWALRDVSFEIKQGEAVGIIGRNGAGKSTLLKILSRITEPTTGRVELHGRVSSLLEVGTGFHPELTGRENIYLNGTILGMRRQEIDRKFDEIVDFSGVAKFLDTPVKRYSSGMQVRLAFSVAAHLEPEILLVDEVLAVGDAEFQKKCLGKMSEVARGGRTVLFVSHNMAAVQALCQTGIVLEQGSMSFQGGAQDAIGHYMTGISYGDGDAHERGSVHLPYDDSKPAQILHITLSDEGGRTRTAYEYDEPPHVLIAFEIREANPNYVAQLLVQDATGVDVFFSFDGDFSERTIADLGAGRYVYKVPLPSRVLKPGHYGVSVRLKLHAHRRTLAYLDRLDSVLSFDVMDTIALKGWGIRQNRGAAVLPPIEWLIEENKADKPMIWQNSESIQSVQRARPTA